MQSKSEKKLQRRKKVCLIIKKLKTKKSNGKNYLKVSNRNITSKVETNTTFRNIWKKVFTITFEENQQFDLQHETDFVSFINNNSQKCKIYHFSEINRLQTIHETDMLIANNDIIQTIKSIKNNTPSETNIRKPIVKTYGR